MRTTELSLAKVIAGVAFAALLGSCGKQQAMQPQMAPEVAVITVEPTDIEFQSSFPATIKGKTDIAIRPQVTGFITKVHVDEGQRVHRGQLLFTLDQVQFRAAVEQAQAGVANAESAVSTAQITADNKRRLLDKNIISETEYQLAANQLAQAQAGLAQARAALVNANKNLAYTEVTSPSDGVIGSIPNREGSLASPSSAQPLTTVSDNSEVYAYFSLSERDILELTDEAKGTINASSFPPVKLQLSDGSLYPLEGHVATVSGVIDSSTGAASSRALFNNPQGRLLSGNTGKVIIPHTNQGVLTVPQRATFEQQDLRYVYVLNDSNQAVPTRIFVEPYSDGQTFVVTSGLNAGDRVITEGVGTSVRPGMKVTPKAPQQ